MAHVVNPLLNEELEIAGWVAGAPDEAFEHGCSMGREIYATDIPDAFDIGVFNVW